MKELIKEIIREEMGLASPTKDVISAHDRTAVIVCTDKRAVVFGYTENAKADPIQVTEARMCLYWDKATGGVFGLSENGPTSGCKISATTNSVSLGGVTAVFDVSDKAINAWSSAPITGR